MRMKMVQAKHALHLKTQEKPTGAVQPSDTAISTTSLSVTAPLPFMQPPKNITSQTLNLSNPPVGFTGSIIPAVRPANGDIPVLNRRPISLKRKRPRTPDWNPSDSDDESSNSNDGEQAMENQDVQVIRQSMNGASQEADVSSSVFGSASDLISSIVNPVSKPDVPVTSNSEPIICSSAFSGSKNIMYMADKSGKEPLSSQACSSLVDKLGLPQGTKVVYLQSPGNKPIRPKPCGAHCPGRQMDYEFIRCGICQTLFHKRCVKMEHIGLNSKFICAVCKSLESATGTPKIAIVPISSPSLSQPTRGSSLIGPPPIRYMGNLQSSLRDRLTVPSKNTALPPPPPLASRPGLGVETGSRIYRVSQAPQPPRLQQLMGSNLTEQSPLSILRPPPLILPAGSAHCPIVLDNSVSKSIPLTVQNSTSKNSVRPTLTTVENFSGNNNATAVLSSLISPSAMPDGQQGVLGNTEAVAFPSTTSNAQLLTFPSTMSQRVNLKEPLQLRIGKVTVMIPPSCVISLKDCIRVLLPPGTLQLPKGEIASLDVDVSNVVPVKDTDSRTNAIEIPEESSEDSESSRIDPEPSVSVEPVPKPTKKTYLMSFRLVQSNLTIMLRIFKCFSFAELLRARLVCSAWNKMIMQPSFWQTVELQSVRVVNWESAGKMFCRMGVKKLSLGSNNLPPQKNSEVPKLMTLDVRYNRSSWKPIVAVVSTVRTLSLLEFDHIPTEILQDLIAKMPEETEIYVKTMSMESDTSDTNTDDEAELSLQESCTSEAMDAVTFGRLNVSEAAIRYHVAENDLAHLVNDKTSMLCETEEQRLLLACMRLTHVGFTMDFPLFLNLSMEIKEQTVTHWKKDCKLEPFLKGVYRRNKHYFDNPMHSGDFKAQIKAHFLELKRLYSQCETSRMFCMFILEMLTFTLETDDDSTEKVTVIALMSNISGARLPVMMIWSKPPPLSTSNIMMCSNADGQPTAKLLYSYFVHVLNRPSFKPSLILFSGQSHLMSEKLLCLCSSRDIILYCVPPMASKYVFPPHHGGSIFLLNEQLHREPLHREGFMEKFKHYMWSPRSVRQYSINRAFTITGCFPLNPQAMEMHIAASESENEDEESSSVEEISNDGEEEMQPTEAQGKALHSGVVSVTDVNKDEDSCVLLSSDDSEEKGGSQKDETRDDINQDIIDKVVRDVLKKGKNNDSEGTENTSAVKDKELARVSELMHREKQNISLEDQTSHEILEGNKDKHGRSGDNFQRSNMEEQKTVASEHNERGNSNLRSDNDNQSRKKENESNSSKLKEKASQADSSDEEEKGPLTINLNADYEEKKEAPQPKKMAVGVPKKKQMVSDPAAVRRLEEVLNAVVEESRNYVSPGGTNEAQPSAGRSQFVSQNARKKIQQQEPVKEMKLVVNSRQVSVLPLAKVGPPEDNEGDSSEEESASQQQQEKEEEKEEKEEEEEEEDSAGAEDEREQEEESDSEVTLTTKKKKKKKRKKNKTKRKKMSSKQEDNEEDSLESPLKKDKKKKKKKKKRSKKSKKNKSSLEKDESSTMDVSVSKADENVVMEDRDNGSLEHRTQEGLDETSKDQSMGNEGNGEDGENGVNNNVKWLRRISLLDHDYIQVCDQDSVMENEENKSEDPSTVTEQDKSGNDEDPKNESIDNSASGTSVKNKDDDKENEETDSDSSNDSNSDSSSSSNGSKNNNTNSSNSSSSSSSSRDSSSNNEDSSKSESDSSEEDVKSASTKVPYSKHSDEIKDQDDSSSDSSDETDSDNEEDEAGSKTSPDDEEEEEEDDDSKCQLCMLSVPPHSKDMLIDWVDCDYNCGRWFHVICILRSKAKANPKKFVCPSCRCKR